MIKKNVRVLIAYLLGIIISLFLPVSISPFLGDNVVLFSVITSIIALGLVYTEMWRCGKYDALKNKVSPINVIGYMSLYIIITIIAEIIFVLFNNTKNMTIPEIIHAVWFMPFIGFFNNDETRLVASLIAAFATIAISTLAYYMGVAGLSLTDNILNARKRRIDKKAEKHFEEIEKIKEEYRKKK